jgi:capsular polysaccharide biosynthesis protein
MPQMSARGRHRLKVLRLDKLPSPRAARVSVRRLVRRMLVRLRIRSSTVRVRPKKWIATPRYVATTGAQWQIVRRAETPVRPAPIQFGPRAVDFASRMEAIPDLGVLHTSRVTVVGPGGLALTSDGRVLSDLSFWHGFPEGLPTTPEARVRRVRGLLVSLASDHATTNYGHYLMDALPRLDLLERAGVSLEAADHIYCGVPSMRAARLLDELGVPGDRRIYAEPGVAIRADRTILPSYPGARRNYPAWVPAFLRERLGVQAGPPTRRLYVPRTTHRRISNVEELMPMLEEHGFEVFEPGGQEDPRHAFAEAAVVVGGHGAGLSDLAFCRPGAAVLELLSDSHPMPFYATLAGSAGLRYGYLLGEGLVPPDRRPRTRWDLRIDPDLFRTALLATLEGSPG